MATMHERAIDMIISSDAQGSSATESRTRISDNGSTATIALEKPIFVPRDALHCQVTAYDASIWYNEYNIKEDVNNQFYFSGLCHVPDPLNIGQTVLTYARVLVKVESGLYDLTTLTNYVGRALRAADINIDSAAYPVGLDPVEFRGDAPTQKTRVVFNYENLVVDFGAPASIGPILGFETTDVLTSHGNTLDNEQFGFISPTVSWGAYLVDIGGGVFNLQFFPNYQQINGGVDWAVGDKIHLTSGVPDEALHQELTVVSIVANTTGFVTFEVSGNDNGVEFNVASGSPEFEVDKGGNANIPLEYVANDVTRLNQISSFLVHCDLVFDGILINDTSSQVVIEVPIRQTDKPGDLIYYEPTHPTPLDARQLIGQRRTAVRAYITDNKLNLLDTKGFSWRFRIRISYLQHGEAE